MESTLQLRWESVWVSASGIKKEREGEEERKIDCVCLREKEWAWVWQCVCEREIEKNRSKQLIHFSGKQTRNSKRKDFHHNFFAAKRKSLLCLDLMLRLTKLNLFKQKINCLFSPFCLLWNEQNKNRGDFNSRPRSRKIEPFHCFFFVSNRNR